MSVKEASFDKGNVQDGGSRIPDGSLVLTTAQAKPERVRRPTAGIVVDRIRNETRDESKNGRWFEQLFRRLALQQPE